MDVVEATTVGSGAGVAGTDGRPAASRSDDRAIDHLRVRRLPLHPPAGAVVGCWTGSRLPSSCGRR
jgi:hypothetical protein